LLKLRSVVFCTTLVVGDPKPKKQKPQTPPPPPPPTPKPPPQKPTTPTTPPHFLDRDFWVVPVSRDSASSLLPLPFISDVPWLHNEFRKACGGRPSDFSFVLTGLRFRPFIVCRFLSADGRSQDFFPTVASPLWMVLFLPPFTAVV